jgi:hypothetical protein
MNTIEYVMLDEDEKSDYDHPRTLITITTLECK